MFPYPKTYTKKKSHAHALVIPATKMQRHRQTNQGQGKLANLVSVGQEAPDAVRVCVSKSKMPGVSPRSLHTPQHTYTQTDPQAHRQTHAHVCTQREGYILCLLCSPSFQAPGFCSTFSLVFGTCSCSGGNEKLREAEGGVSPSIDFDHGFEKQMLYKCCTFFTHS